jgi:GT2 family glycosyltransferase/SAM-dependent methyltransferase/glycosyltransferase involved in cell wall biosynthesis
MSDVNDKEYWDERFKENWAERRGREQSRFFARLGIGLLPDWLKWSIASDKLTLLDWGCALGDGTDVLAQSIDGAVVTGCDFSPAAIDDASLHYPNIEFQCFDVAEGRIDRQWDFVFSSNTLEHFHSPWKVLDAVSRVARMGVILLIPYEEYLRIEEHFYTFEAGNIPFRLDGDFFLAYHRIVDGSSIPETEWAGKQILLIYLRNDAPLAARLKLGHIAAAVALRPDVQNEGEAALINALIQERQQSVQQRLMIAELEGRVSYEQSVAMARIEERDRLNLEVEALQEAVAKAEALAHQAVALADEPEAPAHEPEVSHLLIPEALPKQDGKAESRTQLVGADADVALTRASIRRAADLAKDLSSYASDITVQRDELARQIEQIRISKSWRLTKPLRRLMARFRGHADALELPVSTNLQGPDGRFDHLRSELVEVKKTLDDLNPAMKANRRIFVFTGVPFDDIGGGQRAAQLTRVLLERGERVTYVYAYRKWEGGVPVESTFTTEGLTHLFLDRISFTEVVDGISSNDVAVFEMPHKGFMPYFDHFGEMGARRVFELIDAWDSSLGGDWFDEAVMSRYITESEVVVGTAKVLKDKLVAAGRSDALYLPNAANERIFDSYKEYARPLEIDPDKRSLLYFGSLYGEWFDWDAISLAAKCVGQTANIYLIGEAPAGRTMASNVRFLGSKNIDELPAYLRHCDAALLPFIPGHISDAVSPIKVFEYLAMGVPVIANALPELDGYPNVFVARDGQHFAELCAADLRADAAKVDSFLMRNSWAARADAIVPPRQFGKDISAVVLIHNNARIIERCISSLRLHGQDYLREIIVVDNASTDGGAELVESLFPDVLVVRNPKNGCSSGRNLGVRHATGSMIAFFDSDQWLTSRGSFEEALSILEGNPRIGMVGWAAGWFSGGTESVGGPIADYLPARGTLTQEYRELGYRTDIAYLGSGGMFLRRMIFDAVDGFDEAYDPTCFEDTDISFGVLNAGYYLAYRDLQGIRHQPHQTTAASAGSESYAALFLNNSRYFKEKWGHRPNYFFNVPPEG